MAELLTDLFFGSTYSLFVNIKLVVLYYNKRFLRFIKKLNGGATTTFFSKINNFILLALQLVYDTTLTVYQTIIYFFMPQVILAPLFFLVIDIVCFHIKILLDSYLRTTSGDWYLAIHNIYNHPFLIEAYKIHVYRCKLSFVGI